MDNPSDPSLVDLTLRARCLRSACLARLFARALNPNHGATGNTAAVPREPELAFERR